jgi:polyhydroxyalkanoate synthesis regulator phasin
VRDAVKGYLTLAAGIREVTRQRALGAARALVSQGEATAEQVQQLAEDLLDQSRQNRDAVAALVTYEVDRALGRLGLASSDEVAGLVARVRDLEAEVRRQGGAGPEDASAGPMPPGTPRRRAAPRAATKKAAPRAGAKAPGTKGAARQPAKPGGKAAGAAGGARTPKESPAAAGGQPLAEVAAAGGTGAGEAGGTSS